MSACPTCGDEVQWRKHTGTKKRAPIDMTPFEDGNVVLVKTSWYRHLGVGETTDQVRYKNHFALCPNSDQFPRRDPVAHREKETR